MNWKVLSPASPVLAPPPESGSTKAIFRLIGAASAVEAARAMRPAAVMRARVLTKASSWNGVPVFLQRAVFGVARGPSVPLA